MEEKLRLIVNPANCKAKGLSVSGCVCVYVCKGFERTLCMNAHTHVDVYVYTVFAGKLRWKVKAARRWHFRLYAEEKLLFIRISCFGFMIKSHGAQKQYIHETGKPDNAINNPLDSKPRESDTFTTELCMWENFEEKVCFSEDPERKIPSTQRMHFPIAFW